jgi:TonB-linked SusC/RagA family outer membrane protein
MRSLRLRWQCLTALAGLLPSVVSPPRALAQGTDGATITGVVASDQQQPLMGANVFITELNISVGTNEQGRYTITIPAGRVRGQTVVVRVRSIGFVPGQQSITLNPGAQTANFALKADVNRLQEVVVTGVTGATERAKVPFTVSRVDSADMPVLAVNPLSQLQGKVPGANIASPSGRPGTAPQVILRGPTSINANGRGQEPLYVVDGVILTSGIADLNSADIESVEVVKGAAAASLYGSRAGAGVIQITTKKGRTGSDGVRINARSEYGINDIEGDFGIATHHTFLRSEDGQRFCALDAYGANNSNVCSRVIDYRAEVARINNANGDFAASTVAFPVDPGSVTAGDILRRAFLSNTWPGTTYNPVKQLVDPKALSINDLSVTGHFGQTNFFSSAGYTKQAGAILGLEGFERANGRVNLTQGIGEHWNLDVNSFFSRSVQDGLEQEEGGTGTAGGGNGFFRLTRTPAIVNITQRDTLGRYFIRTNLSAGGVQNENPLYSFANINRDDTRYRYIGGGTLRYAPLTWLDADANFSIDRLNVNSNQFQNRGFRTTNSNPGVNEGVIQNGTANAQSINSSAQLTVRRGLWSDKLVTRSNLRWLYEQQDNDARVLQGNRLAVGEVEDARVATVTQNIQSTRNSTRQMSVSGGTFLDFLDRYTVDLLVRRDGSSRFGADERWQTYGRAAAAWIVNRESWFPQSGPVSQFNLRASIGSAGNTPNVTAQYETYNLTFGGQITANTLGNSKLKPEVVTEVEVGGDLELLSRYGLSVTYAQSLAKNQILPVPVAATTGFSTQWQNAGNLQNKTIEASLTVPIIRRRDLNWQGRLNYTRNRAVVKELFVPPFFLGTNAQAAGALFQVEKGGRFPTFYGREFITKCSQLPDPFRADCGSATSSFQRNDEGYVVWVGAGNNPSMGITNNLWNTFLAPGQAPFGVQANWGMPIVIRNEFGGAIQRPLGHPLPDWRMGVSQNVSYKRLSVYGLVEGAYGQSVYNAGRHWSYLDFLSHDVDQAGKSVQNAKPIGYYYRAPLPDNGSGIGGFYDILGPNNRFMEDASYTKLRELSGSYRIGRIGPMRGEWSVSVIGRNLLTWTSYSGFDPEVGLATSFNNNTNTAGSGLLNAVDAFTFPPLRSVSFVISSSF